MRYRALACDYDGTIAHHGRVAETTAQALARVRESGRKLLLVTGRMLPDLRSVCPDVDDMFDAVVAENGAVLYFPETRESRVLGDRPEEALLQALRRRRVRFDVGASIVATDEPFAEAAVSAIRETGVERTLVFNKGAQGTELLSILVTNNIIGESSRIGYGPAIAVVLLVISLAVIIPYLVATFRKERQA